MACVFPEISVAVTLITLVASGAAIAAAESPTRAATAVKARSPNLPFDGLTST